MPGNPNLESVILEFLMEELEILGFRMRNPRHRIQNPGLSCIPLNEATEKAMLSPQISYFSMTVPFTDFSKPIL